MTSSTPSPSGLLKRSWKWPGIALGGAAALLLGAAGLWLAAPSPRATGPSPSPGRAETPPPPAGPPWFGDMTPASGVTFTYRNGEEADLFTILESVGGGVALLDYDGDGRLDIFVTGGGHFAGPDSREIKGYPSRLYRNLGGWKFQDVTAEVGLDRPLFYTHGCAVADFDRDGWPDLLVTGYGRLVLYHNESHGGRRRFVDVTSRAGLNDTLWSTSAGWADLTGRGYPDLYVCHYLDWSFANNPPCPGKGGVKRDVCGPSRFTAQPHALYLNNGDGTFRAAPRGTLRRDGYGLGVVLADVNDDGRPDIYVGNDAGDNFLYLNRGPGQLEEVGLRAGVALDGNGLFNGSMGVDVGDYDGSGRASLWVTNFQGDNHALYRNVGRERFLYYSQAAGITALGQHFVGFGTAFLDADHDGWEDLVIANGHVLRYPSGSTLKQRPVLLHNGVYRGRRFFTDLSRQGGPFFQTPAVGRGLAVGDLDNDGWPDLVISHTNSPVVLLRNEGAAAHAHRWLGVMLVGRKHRDLAGSTVTLDDGTRRQTRFVKGGGSYLSACDPRLLFGLGPSGECRRLTVRWSWGETQQWEGLGANGYWELREGEAQARKLDIPVR